MNYEMGEKTEQRKLKNKQKKTETNKNVREYHVNPRSKS